jgi:hypothetical protein
MIIVLALNVYTVKKSHDRVLNRARRTTYTPTGLSDTSADNAAASEQNIPAYANSSRSNADEEQNNEKKVRAISLTLIDKVFCPFNKAWNDNSGFARI